MNVLIDILDLLEKGPKPDPETEAALQEMREKYQSIKDLADDPKSSASDILNAMIG